ncbi:hypothetical protein RS030_6803 [Cryptosporidium xiaoi]|uniref:URB1 C-terminal domain-containing protein n=1 Tax=Cryptosporidium xiaoi TaxID=659607 RepID=A0AAV9XTY6_9CRYT
MSPTNKSIINNLQSNSPEIVLETLNTLLPTINENDELNQLIEYVKVSPSCVELFHIWSKYLAESTTQTKKGRKIAKRDKDLGGVSELKEDRIEVIILIKTLNCLSKIIEYATRKQLNIEGTEKENINKLGMFILAKYMVNIYRQLNTTNRDILSSTLRLLTSISNLSEIHKEELLNTFNFNLQQFLSISRYFEPNKDKEVVIDKEDCPIQNFEVIEDELKELNTVRFQYLRFMLSFIVPSVGSKLELCKNHEDGNHQSSINFENKTYYTNLQNFLAIKGIGNAIFKNSAYYDNWKTTMYVLYIFEKWVINNDNIEEAIKKTFFTITIINYIFNNLNDILCNLVLDVQLESTYLSLQSEIQYDKYCSNMFIKYCIILSRLFSYHINAKTRGKTRLVLNWLNSLKNIKYPVIQDIVILVYNELNLSEKMNYYDNINFNYLVHNSYIKMNEKNTYNTSSCGNIDYLLVLNYISKLLNLEYGNNFMEKNDIVDYISNYLFNIDGGYNNNIVEGIQLLSDWIFPNKLMVGLKPLSIRENIFINLSTIVIQINILKRLEYIIEKINQVELESNTDKYYVINKIKQDVYSKFPDINGIVNTLRFYFNKNMNIYNEKDAISYSIMNFKLSNKTNLDGSCNPNAKTKEKTSDYYCDEDELFVNIRSNVIKEEVKTSNENEFSEIGRESNFDGISKSFSLYHYLLNSLNSTAVRCIHCENEFGRVKCKKQDNDNTTFECLIKLKFEIFKLLLELINCILKNFGNEFLLSMGYKFDYTRIVLDELYRECYMNNAFMSSILLCEYKSLFENQIYDIIVHSLKISEIKDCYWNCNKYLLYKFLDGLIQIIYNFRCEKGVNEDNITIDNDAIAITNYFYNFLTGIWLKTVSNLFIFDFNTRYTRIRNLNRIFYYFDSTKIMKYTENNDSKILYFHFKTVLFIFKTLFNYSTLIRDYGINCLNELGIITDENRKIHVEFLDSNLDIIFLLLLICSNINNSTIMDTMNIKNGLTSLRNDLEGVSFYRDTEKYNLNKQNHFNLIFYDYISGVIENIIQNEAKVIKENEKVIINLLKNRFKNWVKIESDQDALQQFDYDLKRTTILNMIRKENGIEYSDYLNGIRNLLRNIRGYYNLLCETNNHEEYNINFLISTYLITISSEKKEEKDINEIKNKIISELLQLNYIKINNTGHLSDDLVFSNYVSDVRAGIFKNKELISMKLRNYLETNSKINKKVLESFTDVIVKFNLNIELILCDGRNESVRNIKEILISGKLNKIENENIVNFLVNNASDLELLFLLRKLIIENVTQTAHFNLVVSRLLETVIKIYVKMNKNRKEEDMNGVKTLFNACFCNLIDDLIDNDIFNRYSNISLLLENEQEPHFNNNIDGKHSLVLPMSLFEYNNDFISFRKIVAELLPYLFFYSKVFYNSLVNLFTFGEFRIDKLPIGIKLLYIIDKNLNTIYNINNYSKRLEKYIEDKDVRESEFINKLSCKLIKIYNEYNKKRNVSLYECNKLIDNFESLKIKDLKPSGIITECELKKYMSHNLNKFTENYKKKDRFSILSELNIIDCKNISNFWEILDILLYKQLNDCKKNTNINSCSIMMNSNLIFDFTTTLFNKFNSLSSDLQSKIDLYSLSEVTYIVYLFYYDSEKFGTSIYYSNSNGDNNDGKGDQTAINTLVSSYNNLLELFQRLDLSSEISLSRTENKSKERRIQNLTWYYCYYYILLTPIIMDKYLNPLYELIMLELMFNINNCENNNFHSDLIRGYNMILNYKTNNSFYSLLININNMEEYKSKYPIPFIETNKVLIGDLKLLLDNIDINDMMCSSNILLVLVSSFVMYIAKNKQNRVRYNNEIYNEIPNFVLLKINRINAFLSKMHELTFNFLNSEHGLNDYNIKDKNQAPKRVLHIVANYIFIEYVLSMEREENKFESTTDKGNSDFKYLKAENVVNFLRITKTKDFTKGECVYNKIIDYSKNNYHGVLSLIPSTWMNEYNNYSALVGDLDENKVYYYFMKLVLCNHAIYKTNFKISQLFNLDDLQSNKELDTNDTCKERTTGEFNINVHKLTRYWYHFYSVYLDNFTEYTDTDKGIKVDFNWINPDINRINNTMKHFPYNSRLISNNTTTFEGNLNYKYESTGNIALEHIYDIGYLLPVINSRFKLAYSILRERGFHNSKNKVKLCENTDDKSKYGNERTCSGFIANYSRLSNSKFNQQIDDNFIWLRNFCKNGSLRLVINSLSCVDFSIRYYSYQVISILFEIISFHFKKYMSKYMTLQKDKIDESDDNSTDNEGSSNKKRRKTKLKKKVKLLRHIFKELPQIYTVLNTLKNTVSGAIDNNSKHINCLRLSSFITNFLSDSIEIVFKPESKLFKKVNYFLLSRPFVDRYDIPLLLSLLYSEDPDDHLKHKSFIFSQLESSVAVLKYLNYNYSSKDSNMELEQEHDAINRRFIISLLLNYVKTNNIYSQHNYFNNIIYTLNIILNIVSDQSCAFIYQTSNVYNSNCNNNYLIGNCITKNNPNIPSIVFEGVKHSESTGKTTYYQNSPSFMITQLLVNQYSILDFIINLIKQIRNITRQNSSLYLEKYRCLSEIQILILKIIIKLVKSVFPNKDDTLHKNNLILSHFKNRGNSTNKTILRFIGGYGNIYSLFNKILICIQLLSGTDSNYACGYNYRDPTNYNGTNEKKEADTNKILLFNLWYYSYFSLLYTIEYIISENSIKLNHYDLIIKFQRIFTNLL